MSFACPREDIKSPRFLAKVINEITQRHSSSGNLVFLSTMCFKSCGFAISRCCFLSQDLGSLAFLSVPFDQVPLLVQKFFIKIQEIL